MKKKLKKKNLIIAIIGIVIFIGAIIGVVLLTTNKDKTSDNKPKKQSEPVVEKKVQIVDESSTSRPYAIMINNLSTARGVQAGLQDAYIVYELIVEGGITRYMALFLDSDTKQIGTVRSARHYYLDYALENDAIYVHHGKSPQAQSDFSALGVDRMEISDPKTAWRDRSNGLAIEHTLYTSIELLDKNIGSKRKERNKDLLLKYSAESLNLKDIENSKEAKSVAVKYSSGTTSQYEYDVENKVYKRSVNGKAHTDYITKEQYTFKNIIAYDVKNNNISGDNKGRQDLQNVGSGNGWYISEGYAVPITWSKSSRSAQTEYKLESGEKLVVNDGNTFIQIYPSGTGSLTVE